MRSHRSITFLLASAACTCAHAQVYFMGLGDLAGGDFNSIATALSADGALVVGSSNSFGGGFGGETQAFLWSQATGMVGLGDLVGGAERSDARAISHDGRFVVGDSNSALALSEAFYWSAEGGMIGLGDLPGGGVVSSAWGVSRDGRVVVGYSKSAASGDDREAFRWTPAQGMIGLGSLAGGFFASEARAVSADGTIIVGRSSSGQAQQGEAFLWTEQTGMVGLGDLPGSIVRSDAFGVSDNGKYIVGNGQSDNGIEAFLWSEDQGMIGLGDLDGGSFISYALDVSNDGRIVVGHGYPAGARAFIWERGVGIREVQDVLLDHGIDITAMGWRHLQSAAAVSPDGLTIVGYGAGPNGPDAWIAHVPAPPTFALLGLATLRASRRRR